MPRIDQISDVLRERQVLLGMDRVSLLKATPSNVQEDQTINMKSNIFAPVSETAKDFSRPHNKRSMILYTFASQPREYVTVSQTVKTAWFKDYLDFGCNQNRREVIPSLVEFSNLNVRSVPEGMCAVNSKSVGCYFVFPLTNARVRYYRDQYRHMSMEIQLEKTAQPVKEANEAQLNCLNARRKLEMEICAELDLANNYNNRAFANLVNHIMHHSVLIKQDMPEPTQTKEDIERKYKKASLEIMTLVWNAVDDELPVKSQA